MLCKGLAVAALFVSAPIAFVSTQDPAPALPQQDRSTAQQLQEQHRQAQRDLAGLQQELDGARAELQRLRQQLERALDALDRNLEPQRERNCTPSRNRLLSHYQWLRDEGHQQRAAAALGRVVEQVGNDQQQRNQVASLLMVDKETAGRCDEVALAIVQNMIEAGIRDPHQFETAALAHFLNGHVGRAVELQRQALAAGGRGDDCRRRLRTYEAAQARLARHEGQADAAGELLAGAHVEPR